MFKTQSLSQLIAESQSHVNLLLDTALCSLQAPQIQYAKKGNSLHLAQGCSSSELPISVNDNTTKLGAQVRFLAITAGVHSPIY